MGTELILGTAGHIDHGKTTLIRCLTGVDTDRLPEEKRRGITIELGFAQLTLGPFRLGIVDVPGHERFVRQMLAGATGMDIALLVVAADDSVKPQTREHLDVLRLLDLKAGVVALTKCDAADPDWIELVEDEVRELTAGSFLQDAPIIRTSAIDHSGVDELKQALTQAAESVVAMTEDRRQQPFRMAIDRVFTLAGHGTVVTGSVVSGVAHLGETLKIEPGGIEVRARGIHNHDEEVPQVAAGQRAAINLAGVHHDQLRRGHELAAPGHLKPSRLIHVVLQVLPDSPRPIKHRQRVRVHLGTAEMMASVVPIGCDRIEPGQSAFAQLFLQQEVVCTWNQPFVVRAESPVVTVGGGRVLVPNANKIRRATGTDERQLEELQSGDCRQRAAAAIYFGALQRDADTVDRLYAAAGIDRPDEIYQQLLQEKQIVTVPISGHRRVTLHPLRLSEYAERVTYVLASMHDAHPLQTMFDRAALASRFEYLGPEAILDRILQQLVEARRIRLTDRAVGLADRAPKLSKNESQLFAELVERYRSAGFQPPSVKQCEQQAQKNQRVVKSLISLAASDGELVEIGDQLYLHAEVEHQLRQIVRQAFAEQPELTVSEIRERLQTTRKFAIPICAYLDRIGITERAGDIRRLKSAKLASGCKD